jgi:multidrug efflux pump subunit AcrA (membrane-fusion protein)
VINADVFSGRAIPGQARSALGRMLDRRVKIGDPVKEGDVVATLDPAPYQAEVDWAASTISARSATDHKVSHARPP